MIKNYDPNIGLGIHTVRTTFMMWGYTGHISHKVGGNCKGCEVISSVLSYMDEEDIELLVENDCDFKIEPYTNLYSFTLKDADGNTTHADEMSMDEVQSYVVGIEITNLEEDK